MIELTEDDIAITNSSIPLDKIKNLKSQLIKGLEDSKKLEKIKGKIETGLKDAREGIHEFRGYTMVDADIRRELSGKIHALQKIEEIINEESEEQK